MFLANMKLRTRNRRVVKNKLFTAEMEKANNLEAVKLEIDVEINKLSTTETEEANNIDTGKKLENNVPINKHSTTETGKAMKIEYIKEHEISKLCTTEKEKTNSLEACGKLKNDVIEDIPDAVINIEFKKVEKPTFLCTECTYTCYSLRTLQKHRQLKNHYVTKKSYTCCSCSYVCDTLKTLQNHVQINGHHIKCAYCKVIFFREEKYENHISERHSKKCPKCEFVAKTTCELKSHHRSTHMKHKCSDCDFGSDFRRGLTVHMRDVHGKKNFEKCQYCEYKSEQTEKVREHTKIHIGYKKYKCGFCDFKSLKEENLRKHEYKHTGIKPYKCPHCPYECSRRFYLISHMRTHTGEKPFHCTECDFKASNRTSLNLHIKSHTGPKPYQCYRCDFSTAVLGSLEAHLEKHDSELVCQYCGFSTKNLGSLSLHFEAHAKLLPFKCFQCKFFTHEKISFASHVAECGKADDTTYEASEKVTVNAAKLRKAEKKNTETKSQKNTRKVPAKNVIKISANMSEYRDLESEIKTVNQKGDNVQLTEETIELCSEVSVQEDVEDEFQKDNSILIITEDKLQNDVQQCKKLETKIILQGHDTEKLTTIPAKLCEKEKATEKKTEEIRFKNNNNNGKFVAKNKKKLKVLLRKLEDNMVDVVVQDESVTAAAEHYVNLLKKYEELEKNHQSLQVNYEKLEKDYKLLQSSYSKLRKCYVISFDVLKKQNERELKRDCHMSDKSAFSAETPIIIRTSCKSTSSKKRRITNNVDEDIETAGQLIENKSGFSIQLCKSSPIRSVPKYLYVTYPRSTNPNTAPNQNFC